MASAEQMNTMPQSFAGVIAQQQQQHHQTSHQSLQMAGNGTRAGERGPKGVFGREDFHSIKEFSGNGREHWSFLFGCAIKSASVEVLTATETGTQ